MRKILLSIILFTCFQLSIKAGNTELSDNSYVSIITCGISEQYLYALFGHSAIRVKDIDKDIDIVFNYGTFTFSEPFFYIKFLKGNLRYFLSVTDFESFYYSYHREHRSIIEQELNLNLAEKNSLYAELKRQLNSEDRYYFYDFSKDNCSTRIIDLLNYTLEEKFANSLEIAGRGNGKTTRELINNYLPDNHIKMGINMVLGHKADKKLEPNEGLFLPDTLKHRLDNIHINKSPLVKSETVIYLPEKSSENSNRSVFKSVLLFFVCIIVFFSLTVIFLSKYLPLYFADISIILSNIILTITAIFGCILLYMLIFSSIDLAKSNHNLLWCNPLYFLLYNRKIRKALAFIFIFCIFAFITFNFSNGLLIFYPILILILMCLINIIIMDNRKLRNTT